VIATLSQCDCKQTVAKTACDCNCKKIVAKIGKVRLQKPVQKLHAAEKESTYKNIVEFQFTNSNKKDVKLPHHRRVFSDCATHNISRTIKLKHIEITCFLSH
jgi:hypothetical protein